MKATALTLLSLLPLSGSEPEKTSFTVLAGFDYAEGMTLPGEVTKLDEKVVQLSGFMKRESPGGGPVEQFLLINDACGCEGTPMMNEIVFCALPEGETTDIKVGLVTCTGKLYVGEVEEDGIVLMLYTMDVDKLESTTGVIATDAQSSSVVANNNSTR